MKKFIWLSLFLLVLFWHDMLYAASIDGPANIRDAPQGNILLTLNDGVTVETVSLDKNWYLLRINAVIALSSLTKEKYLKSGITLFDKQGNPIGRTLDTVNLREFYYEEGKPVVTITAYTFKNNVKIDSDAAFFKGQLIAFTLDNIGYVLNVNSMEKKMLSKVSIREPVLSPNRKRILYSSDNALFLEDILSRNTRKIYDKRKSCASSYSWSPESYSWSPDGKNIALAEKDEVGNIDFIIMINVKNNEIIHKLKGSSFDWKDDEELLLLEPYEGGTDSQKLVLFNISNASRNILKKFNNIYVDTIAISPDHSNVAFYGNINRGERAGIFILNLKTNEYYQLTDNPFGVTLLKWLGDSKNIIWNFCQSGHCSLTIENVIEKKITATYGNNEFIDVSPDLNNIYYSSHYNVGGKAIFMNSIPPSKEVQILGDILILQSNVEEVIARKIKGFSTMEDSERKDLAWWLSNLLYPPFGETYALKDKKLIDELGDILINEKDKEIKSALVVAYQGILQYGSGKYITPYLLQILNDENLDPALRARSAHALYLSDDIAVVYHLLNYINDDNLAIRRSIAESLFRFSKRARNIILPHIIEAIRMENDSEIIQYHSWSLKNINSKEAIPALEKALSRGIVRKDKSIHNIIEALVALGENPTRDILLDGGEFEKKALSYSLSSVSEIDSAFKDIIMNNKENPALRISAIKTMRKEGDEWIYKVRRILKRDEEFRNFLILTAYGDEDPVMRNEARKLLAISER